MLCGCAAPSLDTPDRRLSVNKTTYHVDANRSGWNSSEIRLNPSTVAGPDFRQLWASPRLDSYNATPPRLFATPLYVSNVEVGLSSKGPGFLDLVYAATSTGYVYAINARRTGDLPAGSIIWRNQVATKPCRRGSLGILSTPTIDLARNRLYVAFCDDDSNWNASAIDIRNGLTLPGWPLQLGASQINAPGVNRNGKNQFPDKLAHIQRGALNLSPNGSRLYVAFGGEPTSGWMISVDTENVRVATAFSASQSSDEGVGGMWAAGGPAVDSDGNVYMSTGSSVLNTLAGMGISGVFPDSEGNWGQSVIKLSDSPIRGFELTGTYTPFNYCQAGANDIDLGASSPVVIDLDPRTSANPHLLALGGAKQGNAYLLDRERMPGSLVIRQPCSNDSSTDGSLLAPDPQPQFGQQGPLNVFGPYRDTDGMGDQSRSRSTLAHFRDAQSRDFLLLSGNTKTGPTLTTNIPPSLVKLEIVSNPTRPSYLEMVHAQQSIVFQNPGSPVVSSNGHNDGIVWILDVNKPRSASLYGPDAPQPILYAVDINTMQLLWSSKPGELHPSGKYNEVTVVDGQVIVGTDRIQAFGLGVASKSVTHDQLSAEQPVVADDIGTDVGDGEALYTERCGGCHDNALSPIASRQQLAQLSAGRIVEQLLYGSMQSQALGLSESQINQISVFLANLDSKEQLEQ